MTPSEQCAHARDVLADPDNAGFLDAMLTAILVTWLDLESEVLNCHAEEYSVHPPEFFANLPAIQLARWVMGKAHCDPEEWS